jgi:inner membrane protein
MTLIDKIRGSVLARLLLLVFLVLLMQIPILQIEGAIGEREVTREAAIRSVTGTWGERQTLAGPLLVVPYRERVRDDKNIEHVLTRQAYFLPETLEVSGHIRTERRYRGIFDVPVYLAALELAGEIKTPDFSTWQLAAEDVVWEGASLVVGLTDPKAIRASVSLAWDDAPRAFGPGRGDAQLLVGGISAPIPGLGSEKPGAAHRFAFKLELGGSAELRVLPLGAETKVKLASDWPDPSFTGAYLPATRTVAAGGFEAAWSVPHLGRNFPQRWRAEEVQAGQLEGSAFGVSLISPVDAYTATERAVKYELLFVAMTFLAFYLIELFTRLRLHPVQYLLVGCALALFYLLLLALSEHIGFDLAYLIAAAAVVVVIGGYCFGILPSKRLAGIAAAGLAGLYAFLFVLLQIQDYALLVGAVGIFLVLALVMFVTRKVDWYKVGGGTP